MDADFHSEQNPAPARAIYAQWHLITLFVMQAICAVFFLADTLPENLGYTPPAILESDLSELIITLVLVVSVIYTGSQLYKLIRRNRKVEGQLKLASGAFGELLEEYFSDWSLTPSEREVAQLAIKGFSIEEMARIRQTRPGTIKAQSNSIYRKAGVSGRTQLLSLFIEDLMAEGLPDEKMGTQF